MCRRRRDPRPRQTGSAGENERATMQTGISSAAQSPGQDRAASNQVEAGPALSYWHVWTDENGVSRQTRCQLRAFRRQSMSGAAPQWNDVLGTFGATVLFAVLPIGWIGDWHENPKPQWIVPLSGHWFVETMDGTRVEMGPGDISFGEDQNTRRDAEGRQGHRSGTVGNEPSTLVIVQLQEPPTVARPCRFA
jgi:hypothetical protein